VALAFSQTELSRHCHAVAMDIDATYAACSRSHQHTSHPADTLYVM